MGEIMEVFKNWYREFLTDWDKCLKRCVIAAIQNGHKDKMKKQLGVLFECYSYPEIEKITLQPGFSF